MGERRCIASGNTFENHHLIRFVRGPDAMLVPDISHKLPGRGCYVTATPDLLHRACDKNLFHRHIETKDCEAEMMIDKVTDLLGKRVQQTLGLARRAGLAIGGGGRLASYDFMEAMLIANDASEREAKSHIRRLDPDWVCHAFDASFLGAPFGRDSLAYIGLLPDERGKNGGLTAQIQTDIKRFVPFLRPLGCQDGDSGCITLKDKDVTDYRENVPC